MEQQVLNNFEEILRRAYNIEEEGNGWYHFSKGRESYQGGIRGEGFRIAQKLFVTDPSTQAHLEKDMKKASKSLGECFVEEEGGALWVVRSIPLSAGSPEAIKEMFDTCSIAGRSKAVKKLETQHKKTITLHKPR
jgi:hypothetical protein